LGSYAADATDAVRQRTALPAFPGVDQISVQTEGDRSPGIVGGDYRVGGAKNKDK
jgi:hypothetical protein